MMEALSRRWRGELSYLGLAGMECCWLYPWLRFLMSDRGRAPPVPIFSLLTVLLSALYLTRMLEHKAVPLLVQRLVTLSLAFLSTLLLLRLCIYTDSGIADPEWLLQFVSEAGRVLQYVPSSLTLFAVGLYLWWRGISLAQRELDVGSAGLSFRIGIIAFFWLFGVSAFGARIEATAYAFAYFSLGLVVMGLARTRDVSQSRAGVRSPFNAAWLGTLLASALAVTLLAKVAAWLLSLQTIHALIVWLNPVWRALAWAVTPMAGVLSRLLEMILTFLVRLFEGIFGRLDGESSAFSRLMEQLEALAQQPQADSGGPPTYLQALKWSLLLGVLVGILAALALSITRRRRSSDGGRIAEHALAAAETDTGHAAQGWEDRLHRFRDQLLFVLDRVRGEEYALASVREIYASLTRLSAAVGFPRGEAQTPYEYVQTLQQAFPESPEDITLITDAYVRTHYGQQRFPAVHVKRVRQAWVSIRSRLQHARNG